MFIYLFSHSCEHLKNTIWHEAPIFISLATLPLLSSQISISWMLATPKSRGTFGHKLPGKRLECFTIDQLDPALCVGYKNVVVHCGVNNIKRGGGDVKHWANELTKKLKNICEICPYSKVIVSPILPTRSSWLNNRAMEFNSLLFRYCNANTRVSALDFDSFVDEEGLLNKQFCRFKRPDDPIHLGSSGIFKLSRAIAHKILGSPVDGRLFSDVTKAQNIFSPRSRRSVVQS